MSGGHNYSMVLLDSEENTSIKLWNFCVPQKETETLLSLKPQKIIKVKTSRNSLLPLPAQSNSASKLRVIFAG